MHGRPIPYIDALLNHCLDRAGTDIRLELQIASANIRYPLSMRKF